jgi:uncharacterized delta-60 repeat protein
VLRELLADADSSPVGLVSYCAGVEIACAEISRLTVDFVRPFGVGARSKTRRSALVALLVGVPLAGCTLLASLDPHSASEPLESGVGLTDATDAVSPSCVPLDGTGHKSGDVDTTFGNQGLAVENVLSAQSGRAVVDGDGDITIPAVVFDSFTGKTRFGVVRFNASGSVDPSFGDGGVALVSVPGHEQGAAFGIDLADKGRVVISGNTGTAVAPDASVLVELEKHGAAVPGFASNGILVAPAVPDAPRTFQDLRVDPNGIIVATGSTTVAGNTGVLIARFGSDGVRKTIGGQSEVTTFVDGGMNATLLGLYDGGAVVGGWVPDKGNFVMARYSFADGLDTTFGIVRSPDTGGLDAAAIGAAVGLRYPRGLLVESGGKIVVAGQVNVTVDGGTRLECAVARFLADGAPDPSFGNDGLLVFAAGSFGDAAMGIAKDAAGNYMVASSSLDEPLQAGIPDYRYMSSIVVARVTPTGVLDTSFGRGGTGYTRASMSGMGAGAEPDAVATRVVGVGPTGIAWDACRRRWITPIGVVTAGGASFIGAVAFHP